MTAEHKPVLLNEVMRYLKPSEGEVIVDATLGAGGHSSEILKALGNSGKLISIERDPYMLEIAEKRIGANKGNFEAIKGNFSNIDSILLLRGIKKIDGVLFDFGAASPHFDIADRGFSFKSEGFLDMRYDRTEGISAFDVINDFSEKEIAEILWKYGEERFSRNIARNIVRARSEKVIKTTDDLSAIIRYSIPKKLHPKNIDVCTRSYQGIRIFVNDELNHIETALLKVKDLLNKNGRVVCISFHSLEDRIVKHTFAQWALKCKCPPKQMICNCNKMAEFEILTKKPIIADQEETDENPRARSAKLRAALKLN